MALLYNEVAVSNVTYSDNEVSNVYYNSTKVYTSAINIKFSVDYSGRTTCSFQVPYGFTSSAETFNVSSSSCFKGSCIRCGLTFPGNFLYCYNLCNGYAHFRGFDSSKSKCFCTPSVAISACIVGEDPSGLSVTIDNVRDKTTYELGATTIMIGNTCCYCVRTPAKHELYYCCNALDNTLSNASKKIYDGCIVLANKISSDVDINTRKSTFDGRILIYTGGKTIDFDSYVVVIRKDGKTICIVDDVNLLKLDGCSITIPSECYK